ncbi:MAG: hypothetical protein K0Q87_1597 [Neobacillus sp.]|jgi:chromosome segregation ATPase|nr:hypothetical protein [Neobacillus sp.]
MNELSKVRTADVIAGEINMIKDQTKRVFLQNSIDIGKRLIEAKEKVPHGSWGTWLEENVNYSQRTANQIMQIYEEYGIGQTSIENINADSQTFANLGYSQAVALLSVPREEREQFVIDNDAENMSAREIQKVIKEKKELQQQLDEMNEQASKEKESREKLIDKAKTLLEKNKKLRDDLKDAKSTGNSEAVTQLQNELNDSQKKVQDLQKQLKDKPIDVPATIEKLPEEVKQELAQLRSAHSQEKAVTQFQVTFESLKRDFNDLLKTLKDIKDQETQKEYTRVLEILCDKMKEVL